MKKLIQRPSKSPEKRGDLQEAATGMVAHVDEDGKPSGGGRIKTRPITRPAISIDWSSSAYRDLHAEV
jgi:hypothetical protein